MRVVFHFERRATINLLCTRVFFRSLSSLCTNHKTSATQRLLRQQHHRFRCRLSPCPRCRMPVTPCTGSSVQQRRCVCNTHGSIYVCSAYRSGDKNASVFLCARVRTNGICTSSYRAACVTRRCPCDRRVVLRISLVVVSVDHKTLIHHTTTGDA